MTPEEKTMLQDIHEALFKLPHGSGKDAKPLIEGITIMWTTYQRSSWAFRAIVWLLPAIAGVGIAAQTIKGWIASWGVQ